MSVDQVQDVLHKIGLDATPLEVAEVLWLAGHISPWPVEEHTYPGQTAGVIPPGLLSQSPASTPVDMGSDSRGLHIHEKELGRATEVESVPVRAPMVSALPNATAIGRGLRPLKRRVPSRRRVELDEKATALHFAETRRWRLICRPALVRWLDAVVVIDTHSSMVIWHRLVDELCDMLVRLGAFRDIRRWYLHHTDRGGLCLSTTSDAPQSPRSPAELLDPTGRRLTLVITDAIGPAWDTGAMAELLERCGRHGPTAVLQPLPQRLWERTTLRPMHGRLHAVKPGAANAQWKYVPRSAYDQPVPAQIPVPVLDIEPSSLQALARLITACGDGMDTAISSVDFDGYLPEKTAPTDPRELVARFRATASVEAFELLRHLAAVPLSFPVVRLVQHAIMPETDSSHLAEVYLSGMIERTSVEQSGAHPDTVTFDFAYGVRDVLIGMLRRTEALHVIEAVTALIEPRFEQGRDFPAHMVLLPGSGGKPTQVSRQPFAALAGRILRHATGSPREPEPRQQVLDSDLFAECQQLRPYFLSKAPNPTDADDAVQEVFVRAAEALSRGQQPQVVRTWLSGIARNVLRDLYEDYRRRDGGLLDLGELPAPVNPDAGQSFDFTELPTIPDDLDSLLSKRALVEILESALEGIPAGLRLVMGAHIRESWERQRLVVGDELATLLGMPTSRVSRQLNRARKATMNAIAALVVARTGARDCETLNALLENIRDTDARLDRKRMILNSLQSRQVLEHATNCLVCRVKFDEAREYSRW